MAGASAALSMFPQQNVLVIDAGTCITYDLIDGDGLFLGGIISPGTRIRFRAMHENTGRLPLIDLNEISYMEPIIGKSTREAMKSGVLNGIKGEMEAFINGYRELYPDLKVIMCGGEAKFFESNLKASIFAIPELVLIGLNRILEYNG